MKQRILVLGAGGFIGRRILHALSRTSWAEPIAGSRNGAEVAGVTTLKLDATDARSLAAALPSCDAIVNCVAGSAETIVANAITLRQSLDQDARSPRLVHLSSLA